MKTSVILTGSSQGIGNALKNEFLKDENYQVLGLARSVQSKSERFDTKQIDLSEFEKVHGFRFPDYEGSERIVLVNNAGKIDPIARMGHLSAEAIQENISINLTAPAILINAFLKAYENHPAEKVIINISSGAAFRTIDAWSVYCATKAGLEMLGDAVQDEQEYLGANTRVLNISPGVVATSMQETIRGADGSEFKDLEKFKSLHEEGILKNPEKVALQIKNLIESDQRGKVRLDG